MESNPIISSFWDFVAYSLLDFQMKLQLLYTLIYIFKLSKRKQISLWGCTFCQKAFTQVAQAPKLRTKSQPRKKSQEVLV